MIKSPRIAVAAGGLAFTLVAILNCGGYRYGIGDQAFYLPAVIQHLNPSLFPRDRALLHAQDRLMLYDDVAAAAARVTGVSVPVLFFAAYITGMVLLFGAIVSIANVMVPSWWGVACLAAILTLRHRVTQTGANSLEAYFQPRMVAFALGAWAIAAYLRGRGVAALVLVGVAFAVHPTTALWFGIFISIALAASERQWRMPIALGAVAGAIAAVWAVTVGPLRGHLSHMDPLWASALAGKDYVFPSDWKAGFWIVNFGYLAIAVAIHRHRRSKGVALPREVGLLAGAAALAAVFLVSWPFMLSGVALALQLQTSRIFWLLDFVAAIYIAWLAAEAPGSLALRRTIVAVIMAIALIRGTYVWRAHGDGTPVARIGLPSDEWTDVMSWIKRTPPDAYVLADPGHAWKYGTSVRVAGERDVFLEEVKDLALALYSRDIAVESLRRIEASAHFDSLTAQQLQTLAGHYRLDYLVVDRDLDLPLAYRNDRFRVYALQPPPTVK